MSKPYKKRDKLPAGHPIEYKELYNEKVYKLCLLGATDKEIADIIGIAEATLTIWKSKYPDLLASITKGKDDADSDVANSLYKRACGYEYEETSVTQIGEKEGDEPAKPIKVLRITKTKHHLPPDTAAAFIWLKNRKHKAWKDKHEIDIRGLIGNIDGVKLNDMTEEQAKELFQKAIKGS
jgi:hypothetical protein